MKQSYDNYLNSKVIKFTNKINNVDWKNELIKYLDKEDKSTSNQFSFQEDADVLDDAYLDDAYLDEIANWINNFL